VRQRLDQAARGAARQRQGRSGGHRTVIALRAGERAFFLHCFAKNEQASISDIQLQSLRELAERYLALNNARIEMLLKASELIEVKYGT
jgi:hypothetical protein